MPKKSHVRSTGAKSLISFIKGYLPVRLRLVQHDDAAEDNDDESSNNDQNSTNGPISVDDETFFYVKEHNSGNSSKNNQSSNGDTNAVTHNNTATLFVANCPTIPNIQTKVLLQSIFGRYGDIVRVTVIPKMHNTNNHDRMSSLIEGYSIDSEPYRWTDQYEMKPSYFNTSSFENMEGKFAHIVFSSTKEMKRTFRALHDIMSTDGNRHLPGLTINKIELQTLADKSDHHNSMELEHAVDTDTHLNRNKREMSNVQLIAQQYRTACDVFSSKNRQELLQECNNVMELYEAEEDKAERHQRHVTSVPDDDGFITVSYTAQVGTTKEELENGDDRPVVAGRSRSSTGTKRVRNSKKKKGLGGSEPLHDFYRFQTREHKKQSIQDLRTKFEQDKERIQKLKEQYH